jgi:hypothetical protein
VLVEALAEPESGASFEASSLSRPSSAALALSTLSATPSSLPVPPQPATARESERTGGVVETSQIRHLGHFIATSDETAPQLVHDFTAESSACDPEC